MEIQPPTFHDQHVLLRDFQLVCEGEEEDSYFIASPIRLPLGFKDKLEKLGCSIENVKLWISTQCSVASPVLWKRTYPVFVLCLTAISAIDEQAR
ncbi:predicted protein [Botrytis cinerea T4]|uniref:Uncharacterized protein n=1 Tax=Botryotinia fuckeliana (strain T4) TaxID=999810 RepID=G2XNH3_BOTF4|nr:predicted protein [Botrytis cinerea T4]